MGKFGLVSLAAIALCACEDSSSNATEPVPEKIEGATDVSQHGIDLGDYLSSSAIELPLSSGSNVLVSSDSEQPISSDDTEMSSGGVMPKSSSSRIVPDLSSDSRPPYSSSSKMNPPPESSSSKGPAPHFSFYNGADISTVQEYERWGAKFYDVDGSEKDIFTLLKDHGFNAIRLKTFVSPKAQYGYAASGCDHDAEAYADKDHIIAYAKKIKAAGMAFLLDIHYSDNWADPGKQIIPSRWRNVKSSDAMADSVYNYTYDLISSLKQVNATPEMVQIGNETTPGILIHVPNTGAMG